MADNIKGNLTTILMYVWVLVSPYIAKYVTQDQFIALATAIIGIVIAIVSSYYPNTFKFLNNDKNMDAEYLNEVFGIDEVLNDEYEADIDDSETK